MDANFLARIQFGLNAGFHFIFPSISLGLTLVLLIYESIYLKSGKEKYRIISSFLVKILGLVFAVGVATGIILEFSFGTNWSRYSRMVGDIFGAPLAAEGILAFFLESFFIGVLLFGREKVSKRVYWLSALLVFFASHLSGLWIIIANSWMQTPAGYVISGGRAMLTDFFQAALNPSTVQRYVHTIIASWITGSLFVAGIAGWYVIRQKYEEYSRPMLVLSIFILFAASMLQFGTGHAHSVQVARTQPEKLAAFESLWETREGAPLSVFGIPDEKNRTTHFEIGIPNLLSYLVYMDSNAKVTGLNEFPKEETPPVFVTFATYHVMIGLGSYFLLVSALGVILFALKKLFSARWYLYLLVFSIPLPVIANEMGWISAEIGRQPWAVYRVLKTSDASSVVVPAWQILFSLIGFTLIYILLFAVFMKLLLKIIEKGPENIRTGY
ncbi:MAG: cytochrome ubiquinol oxidase subunit I [Spirochaetes bacterium]|jgi:cytochrome d ubiquinol oxidase subunit I|nr:cytochrome ubiquinol oxidase subunit I [Spirochaetota bacterium]